LPASRSIIIYQNGKNTDNQKVPVENETWSNAEMDWDNDTMLHSVIIYEDLYGTSKIDKQHTL
jgi:hypothetical protein